MALTRQVIEDLIGQSDLLRTSIEGRTGETLVDEFPHLQEGLAASAATLL